MLCSSHVSILLSLVICMRCLLKHSPPIIFGHQLVNVEPVIGTVTPGSGLNVEPLIGTVTPGGGLNLEPVVGTVTPGGGLNMEPLIGTVTPGGGLN